MQPKQWEFPPKISLSLAKPIFWALTALKMHFGEIIKILQILLLTPLKSWKKPFVIIILRLGQLGIKKQWYLRKLLAEDGKTVTDIKARNSHQSLVNTVTVGNEWLPAGTTLLSYTELHHASSLAITMHLNVMYGCVTYLLKEYTMEKLLLSIQRGKVNGFVTQPWIVSSILKSSIVDNYDISSLRLILCSGAIVDKNLCLSFHKRFSVPVINSYGMTELVSGHQNTFSGSLEGKLANAVFRIEFHFLTLSLSLSFIGNVGTLKPGFSCKIVGDDGKGIRTLH